jgi:hypothetical protein
VTRGTRPKKPSSSRGFAGEARGARGSQGLETETFFSLFKTATTTKKQKNKLKINLKNKNFLRLRTVKTRPRGKCGRGRTSGRKGSPDGNFHPIASVMTTVVQSSPISMFFIQMQQVFSKSGLSLIPKIPSIF